MHIEKKYGYSKNTVDIEKKNMDIEKTVWILKKKYGN